MKTEHSLGNTSETIELVDENLRHGFAQVPRPVLRAKGLSLKAKAVYVCLLDYAWQEGRCFPGQQRLADDLGVSVDTVQRALAELRVYGLIRWQRRGLNRPNIYFILRLSDCPNLTMGSESGNRSLRSLETAEAPPQDGATSGPKETQLMRPKSYTHSNTRREKREEEINGLVSDHVARVPGQERARGSNEEPWSITSVLDQRAPVGPANGRVPSEEDRAVIGAYIGDVARQLGDQAPLQVSRARALNLFRQAGTPRQHFVGALFQARAITKDRIWSPGPRSSPPRRPMAFFFAVLSDLLKITAEQHVRSP